MAQFPRKISQVGNPYLIFNPFLTYVANKCKIYVTIYVAKNYNTQQIANKETLFNK